MLSPEGGNAKSLFARIASRTIPHPSPLTGHFPAVSTQPPSECLGAHPSACPIRVLTPTPGSE